MIDYGKQKSTVRPEELELTETKVFVSSNVTEVNEDETDGQPDLSDMNLTLSSMTRTNTLKFRQKRMLILKMKLHRHRLLCVKSMK